MKKIIVLALAVLCCACDKPRKDNKTSILMFAECKMDIQKGSNRNGRKAGLDVVGDSIAVHRLSRYATRICGKLNDTLAMEKGRDPYTWVYDFWDNGLGVYKRDTVNHIFTFPNDVAICFREWYLDEQGEQVGVEGSEYPGLLVWFDYPVFCGRYDTVKHVYIGSYEEFTDFANYPYYNQVYDTLGYIPSTLMRQNRAILTQLLAERRYQDVLDFFKTTYHIYTCTGEEYRELVRLGLN